MPNLKEGRRVTQKRQPIIQIDNDIKMGSFQEKHDTENTASFGNIFALSDKKGHLKNPPEIM